MKKLEERRQRLEERIISLRSRLEKLEAQKEETERAIEEERQRKNEERRGVIADTVEKVLGEIPEAEIPSFEEFLELFREAYTPQITIASQDDAAETGGDFLFENETAAGTDNEETEGEKEEGANQ